MDSDSVWDLKLIEQYINSGGFTNPFKVDAVLTELKKSQIVMGYLKTIEGKLIMAQVVDGVKENMMKIVSLAVGGFDKNINEIRQAALQINIAHEFMFGILTLISRGEDYKKRVLAQ